MSNRQQFVYCDRLAETIINPEYVTPAVGKRKEWRTYLNVRHNKVVHEGKHLLPDTYFKRFIANGGAPRDTSLFDPLRREILFMLLLSPFVRRWHLRVFEAFAKKIKNLNKSSRQIVKKIDE